ncbi:MAG: hypothetical protein U0871_10520 [Gemmataceae bacterium]
MELLAEVAAGVGRPPVAVHQQHHLAAVGGQVLPPAELVFQHQINRLGVRRFARLGGRLSDRRRGQHQARE